MLYMASWSFGFLWYLIIVISADDQDYAEQILSDTILALSNDSFAFSGGLISNDSAGLSSTYGDIECFSNPPPPAPATFESIAHDDYYHLLEQIVVATDTMKQAQRVFRPGDFKQRIVGRCKISVGITPSQAGGSKEPVRVYYRQIELAHLAAKIAQQCFHDGDILGGTVRYGAQRQLLVVLGAIRSGPGASIDA